MSDSKLPNARVRVQDLAGKNAIITGGTQGIGKAIAFQLATRGANILVTYTLPEKKADVAGLQAEVDAVYKSSKTAAPKILGVYGPLQEPKTTYTNVVEAVKKDFNGDTNILALNAGHMEDPAPLEACDEAHVSRFLTGNVEHNIFLMRALLPHFRPDSRIVACSSASTLHAGPYVGLYIASKTALEALTRVWAAELGKRPGTEGTTVNVLSIGMTKSPLLSWMNDKNPDFLADRMKGEIANTLVADRLGEPEDVADIVGWLCSEESRWVTATIVGANGGAGPIF